MYVIFKKKYSWPASRNLKKLDVAMELFSLYDMKISRYFAIWFTYLILTKLIFIKKKRG